MTSKVEVEIKILKDGDDIVGLWDNRVLVKHADGSAEFFILEIDDRGYPRLNNKTWKITKGEGEVHITKDESKSSKGSKGGKAPKVITF
ncbi:hypothetical protein E5T98_21565 [Vibrio vulnificus]|nr:hypothetical protein [Vibrio vulnificus]EIJ0948437.1 hypothetical protein [Vibrio vulnificus]EJD0675972.1 hypothetical protein [Vibrio vulnificus]EJZ7972249.1 hypothetical protein [Vibrio vulnificus]